MIRRYARIVDRLGEEIGDRAMVIPTGEPFPDRFEPDDESYSRLVARMCGHAGMEDIPIDARVVAMSTEQAPEGGCGTGCCSTVERGAAEI